MLEWLSEGSQTYQTVKYGHESRGTWNEESLRWQVSAAICQAVSLQLWITNHGSEVSRESKTTETGGRREWLGVLSLIVRHCYQTIISES